MSKFVGIVFLFQALLSWQGVASAQQSFPDPFAKSPKARLLVTVELKGSGRKDLSNKVEWYRLTASRKLDLELAMVMPMKSPAPTLRVGGVDKDNAPMPSGLEALRKAIEGCNGNQSCEQAAAMKMSQQMMANPQAFNIKANEDRFENWIARVGGACAKGTASVDDQGDGVNISPPAPARPYKFRRAGHLNLPATEKVMELVCRADLSVDKEKGLVSLRLSEFAFPVPVSFSGDLFAVQKSTPFLEGARKIELSDQKVDPEAREWSGTTPLDKIGMASHNSGQTSAPLSGTMAWRFVRD
jgi:hypothetical protein